MAKFVESAQAVVVLEVSFPSTCVYEVRNLSSRRRRWLSLLATSPAVEVVMVMQRWALYSAEGGDGGGSDVSGGESSATAQSTSASGGERAKSASSGATSAGATEKMVPLSEVISERRHRQAVQAELDEVRRELAAREEAVKELAELKAQLARREALDAALSAVPAEMEIPTEGLASLREVVSSISFSDEADLKAKVAKLVAVAQRAKVASASSASAVSGRSSRSDGGPATVGDAKGSGRGGRETPADILARVIARRGGGAGA